MNPGEESTSGLGSDPAKPSSGKEWALTLLLLRLGRRWFAVDVRAIEEVALKGQVTRVPKAPSHFVGVTTLRGRLVTVVGLEQMIGGAGILPIQNPLTLPRLLVVRNGVYEIAVVAEEIHGMIEHTPQVEPASPEVTEMPDFVREEFEWQGNHVVLLDAPLLIAAAARLAGIPSLRQDGVS